MQLHRAQPSEARAASQWIAARHYLESCPAGWVHIYEFTEGRDLIGAMLVGRPSAKSYDPDKILQLHRMFFVDETAHCVESQALAIMRKNIRTWLPGIRGLLSYSDPSVGHKGTVYEADNWCPLGLTDEPSEFAWQSRPGRKKAKRSRKMRWFRTP